MEAIPLVLLFLVLLVAVARSRSLVLAVAVGCFGLVLLFVIALIVIPAFVYHHSSVLDPIATIDLIRVRVGAPMTAGVDSVVIYGRYTVDGRYVLSPGQEYSEYIQMWPPGSRSKVGVRAHGRWLDCAIPPIGSVRWFKRDRYTLWVSVANTAAPGAAGPLSCRWGKD